MNEVSQSQPSQTVWVRRWEERSTRSRSRHTLKPAGEGGGDINRIGILLPPPYKSKRESPAIQLYVHAEPLSVRGRCMSTVKILMS